MRGVVNREVNMDTRIKNFHRVIAAAALVGVAITLSPGAATAADAVSFKGKTFTVMVASRPGGGTDTTGRLVARFWGRHLPGNPKVLVRNKGMQLIGANYLHNQVRPNGLTVGVFAGAGSLGPIIRKSGAVRYDPLSWGLVGSVQRGPSIQLIRKSALARLSDSKAKPVAFGTVSTVRPADATAVYGKEYLNWNLRIVLGYPNSNATYLAYTRGEIDMFGSGTTKILNRFIKDEGAVPISAEAKRSDFPNVPVFETVLGDKKPGGVKWQAFLAWSGTSSIDKYFAAPPKTPAKLLKVLRASYLATTKDPQFVKAATQILGGGYQISNGPQTLELVKNALVIPPAAQKEIERLRKKHGLPSMKIKAVPLVAVTFDEVKRGGRVLNFTHKGKKMKLRVSGSRSEITIGGKLVARSALKSGMTCLMNWKKRGDRIEARKVDCLAKVTFDKVQRGGRVLLFTHDGKNMKLRVSGSRSEITVGGKLVPRSKLKAGMTCSLKWKKRGDRLEASTVVCP